METTKTAYFNSREKWRDWLKENFQTEKEIWLIYPNKSTGKQRILYNDAVEEALCFGWIDSTMKKYDATHSMQRFTPRNPKSAYSQPNKERLKWLVENKMLHPEIHKNVAHVLTEEFVYPPDIITALQADEETWRNFQAFSESYKRIRVAYIQGARSRPDEFEKRLRNFLKKTKRNKKIIGHGGIDKYY